MAGYPMEPDTPFPWSSPPGPGALEGLDDGELIAWMGLAPAAMRPAFKAEFDRRLLPDGLGGLSCTALVEALVNYPLDLAAGEGQE
jgi:hypothetical protein